MIDLAIASGELLAAHWSQDGRKLTTSHCAGDLFGVVDTEFVFPETYPLKPPVLTILTPLVHPNVYSHRHRFPDMRGKVCMTILDNNAGTGNSQSDHWTPAFDVPNILRALTVVLNNPGCESPANVDANRLYLSNNEEYVAQNLSEREIRETRKIKAAQDEEFEAALLRDSEKELQKLEQKPSSSKQEQKVETSEKKHDANEETEEAEDLVYDSSCIQRIRTQNGQENFEFGTNGGTTVGDLKAALERKRKRSLTLRTLDGVLDDGESLDKYQKITIIVDED